MTSAGYIFAVFWLTVGLAITSVAVYDPIAAWKDWTLVSAWFLNETMKQPIIAVVFVVIIVWMFGVLCGHLFWPQEAVR